MDRRKMFLLIFAALFGLAISIAGCGGGGGAAGTPSKVSVITGVVSDGPIKNARVTLDLNGNGKHDDGEPFSITNDRGEYRIEFILDPGTEYMLIADGSSALGTSDLQDNPADGTALTFHMFISVTASGSRNAEPTAAAYRHDVTPMTFKAYLTQINNRLGGISDVNILNIVNSASGSVDLFKSYIKNNQDSLRIIALQVAATIESSNRQKDLQLIKGDLAAGPGSVLDFVENKTIQDVSNSLNYQNMTVSIIGDTVISKPKAAASTADVLLTNMATAETLQKLNLTIHAGSLSGYAVSVTPYNSILEIPEYGQIRAKGGMVVLGADITAKDGGGAKNMDQWLNCSIASPAGNAFAGLEYYYFDGAGWIRYGEATEGMNVIKTAPFVIVRTGNIVEKTLSIQGMSQLDKPAVFIKGYRSGSSAQGTMILDVFPLVQASDTVTVKIPADFIIAEVVIVDSELSGVSTDGKPYLSLPVTDSIQTDLVSATLSTVKAKIIIDPSLHSALKNGSQDQDFPGIGAYIDTKAVYRQVDMFLDLSLDEAVKSIINENITRYLGGGVPTFYSGSGTFPGVMIDSGRKIIEVNLAEENSSLFLSWRFEANKIVRTYRKDHTGGTKKGSIERSTSTFSSIAQNQLNVLFDESVTELVNNIQTVTDSYEGSAVFNQDTGILTSAKFYQELSETTENKTNTLKGTITMENEELSFDGSYSFYLRSYGAVSGSVNISKGAYSKGYSFLDKTYFNNNTLQNASALFSAPSGHAVPAAMPAWLIGVWTGAFTDSGDAGNPGKINIIVTDTNATWWGQSYDKARNYGTGVEVDGSAVRLLEDSSLWSTGNKVSDTRLEGSWSYNGYSGSFFANKMQ